MLTALTLPALAILIGFPGLPGLPTKMPRLRLHKTHTQTAADSLPPTWKSASRLALEDQFVVAGLPKPRTVIREGRLEVRPLDQHWSVRTRFDADSGRVMTSVVVAGEFSVGPGVNQ